ncbi:hypothetical protein [Legionella maceachernii]|uniref:hypothetical protein n=1 Tax=Legionella maceachernii TaxID=466 RepID=UPI001BE024AF|nr:hypothetical protein [Legionella maceachernii]
MSTLRKGRLGDDLRTFIKEGHADCIIGRPVNTVSDFVKALQESIPPQRPTFEMP